MGIAVVDQLNGYWDAKEAFTVIKSAYNGKRVDFVVNDWIKVKMPLSDEGMSYVSLEVRSPKTIKEYTARTSLGKKLLSIRKRAINTGMPLLSVDQILEEVKARRGELVNEETDLY